MHEKTKGAAEAYGKTLAGQISIASAEVHNLGKSFGEFLIPKITEALTFVTKSVEWFGKHKAVAEALAITIGTVLAGAVAVFAVNTGVKMIRSVQDAGKALGGMASKIAGYIGGLGEAEGAEEGFAATSEETGAASSAAFGPVGLAILAVVTVGTLLATHWKEVSKILLKVWDGIKEVGVKVWHLLEDGMHEFVSFLQGPFGTAIAAIVTIFDPWIGIPLLIIGHWQSILSFFKRLPQEIESFFAGAGHWLEGAGKDILKGLWTGFEYLSPVGLIIKFHDQILDALSAAGSWLLEIGKDILHGLFIGFEYLTPAGLIYKFHDQILSALSDAGSWLLNIGKDVVTGLWNGVSGAASWLGSQLGKIAGWFWDGLKDAAKWLEQTGVNIIIGLWNGISSMGGWLWDKVKGFASHFVTGAVHDVLSIFSPSQVMHQTGVYVAQGLAEGILSSTGMVSAASKALAHAAMEAQPNLQLAVSGISPSASGSTAASAITGAPAGAAGAPQATGTTFNLGGIVVQGNVATEEDLGQAIWRFLLSKGITNGSPGQLGSL